MRSLRVCLFVLVAAIGCGESARREGDLVECTTDLDCAEGQSCVASKDMARDLETFGGGAGIGTGGFGVCPPSSCGSGCPPGQVCKTGSVLGCPSSLSCVGACADPDAVPCDLGTVCRASGFCEPIRCDDPEYTGCPTGMTCDTTVDPASPLPGRYTLFGTDQYPYTDFDRGPVLTERQMQAAAASCVFLRCDESGGFDCAEGFHCDVENASPTNTGCAGISCGELGRCSGDAYICEPTSSGSRPVLVDVHGCVMKNCEEGAPCPESTECDFTRPGTGTGCAYIRCDEPGGSCTQDSKKCAPDSEPERLPSGLKDSPDVFGCVFKRCDIDEYPCPDGMVCDPANPGGALSGCAHPPEPPDTGTGGTGGTTNGGTGGTSGTGAGTPSAGASGSAGEGGTMTDPRLPGVCR